MKVSELKSNSKNPRFVRDANFEKLKESITAFPAMMELRPIIVDENNMILGGNMRFEAIKALGLKEIPDSWVKRAAELSDEQKKEFIIKDNSSFGEWDWDLFTSFGFDEMPVEDWGLSIPTFEPPPDLDEFFTEQTEEKELKNKIVLEYTEEEHALVKEKLATVARTPEQAVWQLLGL